MTKSAEPTIKPPRHGRIVGALLGLALVGFSAGFAGAAAFAGTAVSSNGYFTTAYAQWENNAYIGTSSGSAQAWTAIERYPISGNVPTGYMGARGRLFIGGSTTNMSCEGTTTYNNQPTLDWIGNSCTRTTHGTRNSYGVTYGWTGTGYQASYTYNSPNQTS